MAGGKARSIIGTLKPTTRTARRRIFVTKKFVMQNKNLEQFVAPEVFLTVSAFLTRQTKRLLSNMKAEYDVTAVQVDSI